MKPRNVAILLLYNGKNELLLQHRSDTAKRYPGLWGVFGGGIEENETPEQAVRREALEELEYTCRAPELIFTQEFENAYREGRASKYAFVERYDETQKLIQHEGQGLNWFAFEKFSDVPTIGHDAPVFEAFRAYIKQIEQ